MIPAVKMHGLGNDFVIVDNRDLKMAGIDMEEFVRRICTRRLSIGADGFMMLEPSKIADFKMRYFNADGSEGEMCGNGARCLGKYAHLIGLVGEHMRFETVFDTYEAWITGGGRRVKVRYPDVKLDSVKLNQNHVFDDVAVDYHYVFIGVPHAVVFETDIIEDLQYDITPLGKAMRYSQDIFPQGTNVNFIHQRDAHNIYIRTYERGVEDETFACGTGSTASAVISSLLGRTSSPVDMHTRVGIVRISLEMSKHSIENLCMEADAKLVAQGYICEDAWNF